MLADLKMGTDGDLDITGATLSLVSGRSVVRQMLFIRCMIHLGEWFLDTSFGVPWRTFFQTKDPGFGIKAFFLSYLRKVPGVRLIENVLVTADGETRTGSIVFHYVLQNGQVGNLDLTV
jgi:hypothetical protein